MASNKTRPNLNDIRGLDIAETPQVNDVLQFNGTSWVNAPFTGGSGGGGSGGDRIVDAVDGTTILAVEKGFMSLSIESTNVLSADDTSLTVLSPTQNLNQWWVKVDENNTSGQAFGMSVCIDPEIGHTYALGAADTTKPYVISFDAVGNLRWKYTLAYESYSHLTNNSTFMPTGISVNASYVYVTLYSDHSVSIIISLDKATGSPLGSYSSGTTSADGTNGMFASTVAGPNKVLAVGRTSDQLGRLDVFNTNLAITDQMSMSSSAPNGAISIVSVDMKTEDYATIGFHEGYDTFGVARVSLASTPSIVWASTKTGITVGGVATNSTGESYAVSTADFIDGNIAFTVAKFSTTGSVVWSKTFTSVGNGEFTHVMRYSIACNELTGDVFVWGTCNASHPTYTDWFLLSISSAGNTNWCKRIGCFARSGDNLYNQAEGIGNYDVRYDAIDVSGQNVAVVGQTSQLMFVGSFDAAGGIPTSTLMEVVDVTNSVRSINSSWFSPSTNYQLTTFSPNWLSISIFNQITLVSTDKHKLLEPVTLTVAGDINVLGRVMTDGSAGLPGESLIATSDGIKWGIPPSPVATSSDNWNLALTPDPSYGTFNVNNNNTADNIAIGPGVMAFANGIYDSVSIGVESQQYAENVNWCVSIGYETAQNIVSGDYNVALGYRAYFGDSGGGGTNNVAIGSNSMYRSNGIEDSIAIGYNTLRNTTSAYQTIAIGYEAMKNVTNASSSNIAIGNMAMGWCNTPGAGNIAIGEGSLYYANSTNPNANTGNVAIGSWALGYPNAAFRNTAVGSYALSYDAFDNCTGIGYNSSVTGANQVQLGDSSTTTYVYGTVQNRSDARDKTDIRDTTLGLSFIESLRPVDYRWDYRSDYVYTFVDDYGTRHDMMSNKRIIVDDHGDQHTVTNANIDGSRKRNRYHHGLIAQEVKQVAEKIGVEFGGYQDHSITGGEDVLSIGYDELIAPLIKAVQELANELADAKRRIAELESKS